MPEANLPDFVVIGAMSAGTSTLYRTLQEHSSINMAVVKNPNFFNTSEDRKGNWELGPAWYQDLFLPRAGLRGESSDAYTRFPATTGAASRIKKTNPLTKLIYLIRNPIDRTLSHYLHNVLNGTERRVLVDVFQSPESNYVLTSMYLMQLDPFLRRFPRKQLFILISERLWDKPNEELSRLYDFLELSSYGFASSILERRNATALRLALRVSDPPKNPAQEEFWTAMRSGRISASMSARDIAPLLGFDTEFKRKLSRRFEENVEDLYAFLGFRIGEWRRDFH
jgi:hypothetical protein